MSDVDMFVPELALACRQMRSHWEAGEDHKIDGVWTFVTDTMLVMFDMGYVDSKQFVELLHYILPWEEGATHLIGHGDQAIRNDIWEIISDEN